jgi:hypothetical protein
MTINPNSIVPLAAGILILWAIGTMVDSFIPGLTISGNANELAIISGACSLWMIANGKK